MSIIFDARKHAERSRSARAAAGAERPPAESETLSPRSDEGAEGHATSPSKPVVPIVRHLLKARRARPSSALPSSPGFFSENEQHLPSTQISESTSSAALPEPHPVAESVEVCFGLNPDGQVDGLRVVKGKPVIARAVVEAIEATRYAPVRVAGIATALYVLSTFVFET